MKFLPVIIFVFSGNVVCAQSCSGSLGDPIINVTFGSGQNFGPSLGSNTTSALNYEASTCPIDGNYSIVNYTSGCFSSGNDVTWHTTTDHTGDTNGYFMLVNASYQPSNFYIQTITGLCEGTTYQFAAWLLNMCSVSGILPDITFTIEKTDGSMLTGYNTGDIPIINPVTWKQYGFNFTTPPGVSSVVLRMRNNAPGGVGNDVGLDDITFRPAGPAISIHTTAVTGDVVSVCADDLQDIVFQSSVENCYVPAYQWQLSNNTGAWNDIPGATGNLYTRPPTAPGVYVYRLAVAQQNNIGISTCRVVSNPIVVNVYANDVSTITIAKPGGSICEGSAVTFTATTAYAGVTPSYRWQVNGSPAGTDSTSYTGNNLITGDVINCILTSSIPCNMPVISNSITVTVNRRSTSTISRSVCEGDSYEGYTTTGTYTDVFAGSNGCDSTRTLHLTVYPKQFSEVDTTICFGTSYEGLTQAGTYNTTYTSVNGCDSVHVINLTILPDINSNPSADTVLCSGDVIVLSPGNFDTYLWQNGSTQSSLPVHAGGTYSVQVSNRCGTAIKTTFIDERVCNIMFPSAFTPNNDGTNDIFKILNAYNLIYYRCIIFNRWGQKIFESGDPQKGWDGFLNGVPQDIGTYAWICNYTRAGNTGITHLKGTVTLLR